MKVLGRVILIVVGAIVILALAVWLNLPRSAGLYVQSLADQRHPATFEFAFEGLPREVGPAGVSLLYYPQTPIFGISAHYWSIIAPLQIDRITRELHLPAAGGEIRFEAPLSLVGLSNFRLTNVSVEFPSARSFPINFGISVTQNQGPPAASALPKALVDATSYTFDGPFGLWQLTGAIGQDDDRAFSPRFPNQTRAVIWPGLRAFRARIDMAAYPAPTFQPPAEWVGLGWHRDGINVTQAGARFTDELVTLRRGMTVRIPFARDCASTPEFVSVRARERPEWSKRNGLWTPLEIPEWRAFVRAHPSPELQVAFLSLDPVSADGVEAVSLHSERPGMYRLFGACPSPRYDSLAVAWIDVSITS